MENEKQNITLIQCDCGGYGKVENSSFATFLEVDCERIEIYSVCNQCGKELSVKFFIQD
jgi:hypothetical protein